MAFGGWQLGELTTELDGDRGLRTAAASTERTVAMAKFHEQEGRRLADAAQHLVTPARRGGYELHSSGEQRNLARAFETPPHQLASTDDMRTAQLAALSQSAISRDSATSKLSQEAFLAQVNH